MNDHTVGIATRDELAIEYAAASAGLTTREWLERLIARRAVTLPLPPGPRRPRAVVLAQRIADRTAAGEPTSQIAAVYGIDPDHVRRIREQTATIDDRSTP